MAGDESVQNSHVHLEVHIAGLYLQTAFLANRNVRYMDVEALLVLDSSGFANTPDDGAADGGEARDCTSGDSEVDSRAHIAVAYHGSFLEGV